MSASTSPLVNLVQAIHLPSHRFLLTTSPHQSTSGGSSSSSSKVTLHLFAHTPSSDGGGDSSDGNSVGYDGNGDRRPMIIVWEGEVEIKKRGVEPEVLADAIKKGYLHVDMPLTNVTELSNAEEVALKILPPESDPSTFRMISVPSSIGVPHLLEATYELLARPTAVPDKTELRSLRSQLDQKDAEIASLSTKLASAKATVVRATASDNSNNKKKLLSPVKKTPVNASGLQPNVKRRRVADDEYGFAGSGSEGEDE